MVSTLAKTKMEEDSKKQAETSVKDPTTALNFLIDGDFKSEDDEMTFEALGVIAMQLSVCRNKPEP